ncbi:TPA: LysR family transcriptional regulator [Klebsiella variicola]|nr:LysR family transcriptional regulator [Klebsiella variicola]HCB0487618.1 LysR family transcriptional regulator [Klebsiella pneumoniae]
MNGNIEVKWLHDAVILEEYRSFTLAAEKRNISQSSFSRRIQALETAIGFDIFDRSSTPLTLTSQGKSFIVYARNLLEDMNVQINRIKGLNSQKQRINIAAAHSLSVFLLPQFIDEFICEQKNTFFIESINVDEAVYNLKEGKCDFILSFYNEELMASPFLHHKILETGLHLVSACNSTGLPLYSLDDENLPFMQYTDESYMGRLVNQLLGKTIIPFSYNIVSSMSDLLKRMILNGNGVGWLPEYSITQELRSGQLRVLDTQLSIEVGVYIYRAGSRLNLSSERFWQHMKTRNTQED